SGNSKREANFVQPESATAAPRATGLVKARKPQIKSAGPIESFVFELDAYCVKGHATHAKASAAASRGPPKRRPTSASPTIASRSKRIEVKCTAGSESHWPLQPKIA